MAEQKLCKSIAKNMAKNAWKHRKAIVDKTRERQSDQRKSFRKIRIFEERAMMNMRIAIDNEREAKRIWDIQGRLFIMPLSAKQIRCEMGGLAADTRDRGIR